MYPHTFFNLFPPFPSDGCVFVIMSFHPRFHSRWEKVIISSIRAVSLEPRRGDSGRISDSILTEVLENIGRSRLILADISEMGRLKVEEMDNHTYGVHNSNVMYEVGIAHAVRQPQEVLLFRSDHGELPFDVSPIKVNFYDPDGEPEQARRVVTEAIED